MRERVSQALLVFMGNISSRSQKYYENMKFHSSLQSLGLRKLPDPVSPGPAFCCLHTLNTCISDTVLPRRDVRCLLDLIVLLCNTLSSSQLTKAEARRENKAYFPWLDLSGESLWTFSLVSKFYLFIYFFASNSQGIKLFWARHWREHA